MNVLNLTDNCVGFVDNAQNLYNSENKTLQNIDDENDKIINSLNLLLV